MPTESCPSAPQPVSALRANAPVFTPSTATGTGALPRRASMTATHPSQQQPLNRRSAAQSLPRGRSFQGRPTSLNVAPAAQSSGNMPMSAGRGSGGTAAAAAAGSGPPQAPSGNGGHASNESKTASQDAYRMRQARASRSFVSKKRGDLQPQLSSDPFDFARARLNARPSQPDEQGNAMPPEHSQAQDQKLPQRATQPHHQPQRQDQKQNLQPHQQHGQGQKRSNKNNRKKSGITPKNRNPNRQDQPLPESLSISLSDTSSNPDPSTALQGPDFDALDPFSPRSESKVDTFPAGPKSDATGPSTPSAAVVFAARHPAGDSACRDDDAKETRDIRRDPFAVSVPSRVRQEQSQIKPASMSSSPATSPIPRPFISEEEPVTAVAFLSDDGNDQMGMGSGASSTTPAPRARPSSMSRDSPTTSLVSAPSSAPDSPDRGNTEEGSPREHACPERGSADCCEHRSVEMDSERMRQFTCEQDVAAARTDPSQSMPESGKWCQECAGLGLHIAALVAQMQVGKSQQALDGTDGMKDKDMSAPEKKSSWKRTVSAAMLGTSTSSSEAAKIKADKIRLEEENAVLRATVEYLYKKVETLAPPTTSG